MATEHSINESMDKATRHYSSLFSLPSLRASFAALAVVCILVIGLSSPLTIESAYLSLAFGLSLFGLTLLGNYVLTEVILRGDPVFVLRRTAALFLFSWLLWLVFLLPGSLVGLYVGLWLWVKLCLLGFSAVTTLQAVVFFSVSSLGTIPRVLAALVQPVLCILPFLTYWVFVLQADLLSILLFLFLASFLSLASANLLVSLIDRLGFKTYGVPAMSLFRAFMLNWTLGLNVPMENYFERLGENHEVEVSLLKFEAVKTKAAIVVPLVHPGPFKNLGSSLLPSLMKFEFEKAFSGEACVPLGILGHELDLASQAQTRKVIAAVLSSSNQTTFSDTAKPLVKVVEGNITVCCQVFGDTALLSFSLAPKTTEDLPQELGCYVREEAKRLGLRDAIVINAHNSITDVATMDASLATLEEVASKCLSKAVSFAESAFKVGATTVHPEGFTIKNGMGAGGITAIVVEVYKQKNVYIVIDSNNMISGLREKLLSGVFTLGFDEGEIFTTDTHSVNALVLGGRGYHPIGEVTNNELLLECIKGAVLKAIVNMELCKVGSIALTVPNVRVIGKARIEGLSSLIDQAIQRAKHFLVPIFGLEGMLLILLLAAL